MIFVAGFMNRWTNQDGVTFTRVPGQIVGRSLTTTPQRIAQGMIVKKRTPVTPGELLREEFLIPMTISQYRLAKEIGLPAQRISEIVAGKRAITADTNVRLCRFFGLSKGYRLRAQAAYEIEVAEGRNS
jgi:antitoxin HigA-1